MGDYIVVKQPKSIGMALLLTILFGPVGLLYSSVFGGLMMMFVGFVGILLYVFAPLLVITWELSDMVMYFFLIPLGYWILCVIWACIGVVDYNNELETKSRGLQGWQGYPGSPSDEKRQRLVTNTESRSVDFPSPQEWLKQNPGKVLNDYYAKFK